MFSKPVLPTFCQFCDTIYAQQHKIHHKKRKLFTAFRNDLRLDILFHSNDSIFYVIFHAMLLARTINMQRQLHSLLEWYCIETPQQ